jgi:hypothetical protein
LDKVLTLMQKIHQQHNWPFLGVSQNPQVDALRNGVDILIATQEDY